MIREPGFQVVMHTGKSRVKELDLNTLTQLVAMTDFKRLYDLLDMHKKRKYSKKNFKYCNLNDGIGVLEM